MGSQSSGILQSWYKMDNIARPKSLSAVLFVVSALLLFKCNSYKKENLDLTDERLLMDGQKVTAEFKTGTCDKLKAEAENNIQVCSGELKGVRDAKQAAENAKIAAEEALAALQNRQGAPPLQ